MATFEHGAPWEQQEGINSTQSGDLSSAWASATNLPVGFVAGQAILIKNKVHLFSFAATSTTNYSGVLTYDVDSSGILSSSYTTGSGSIECRLASVVIVGPYVYLLGGYTGSAYTASIYRAEIDLDDGSLGSFSYYGDLPLAYGLFSAAVIADRLYLFGGTFSSTSTNVRASVYYAELDSQGDLGSWASSGNLSYGVKESQLVVTSGYVYLLGGAIYNSQTYNCQRAQRNGDGSLGTWETVSGLTVPNSAPVWGAAVVVADDAFYMFGGRTGSTLATISNNVRYGSIDSNGEITSFAVSSTSLYPYSYAGAYGCSAIITSSRVYVFGGINTLGTYTPYVQYHTYSGGLNDYTPYLGDIATTPMGSGAVEQFDEVSSAGVVASVGFGAVDQPVDELTVGGVNGASILTIEQVEDEVLGYGVVASVGFGVVEQAEDAVEASGSGYILGYGAVDEALSSIEGTASNYADTVYGVGAVESPLDEVVIEGLTSPAVGEVVQPIDNVSAHGIVPSAGFGVIRQPVSRVFALGFIGEYIAVGAVTQPSDTVTASGITSVIGYGAAEQGGIVSGYAKNFNPVYGAGAVYGPSDSVSAYAEVAATGVGVVFTIDGVSSYGIVPSVGFAAVFQPVDLINGTSITTLSPVDLTFSRCYSGLAATEETNDPSLLSFSRCSS